MEIRQFQDNSKMSRAGWDDRLPYDLIIVKVEVCGLDGNSLRVFLITWAAENKKSKWDLPIVIGVRVFMGFLEDQF